MWKRQPFWGKYSDRNVERVGRKDGSLDPPVPPWDTPVLPPFLWELVQAGDSDIQLLKQGWSGEDKDLLPAWQAKAHEDVRAQKEADLSETALNAAEKDYENAHGGKPVPTDRRFGLYRLANAVLALAEIPFNAIVFRSVGESEVMTIVFTVALAVSVVGCAHFLGVFLHKLRDKAGKVIRKHAAFAALLALIPLGVIASIAWFRAEYLACPKPAIVPMHEMLASGTPPPVAHAVLTDSVRFAVMPTLCSFLLFNLILFLLATVYSFHVHDELLATVYRRRAERRAALKNRSRKHQVLVQARGRREKRHMHYQGFAHQCGKNVRRLIEAYRTHNLQTRNDRGKYPGRYPLSFDKYGGIDLPKELEVLDWPAESTKVTQEQALIVDPRRISNQEQENHHVNNGYSVTIL